MSVVWHIIDSGAENDTAPYPVYLFDRAYERRFGRTEPYKEIERTCNDYVLSMEAEIRRKIVSSPDPLASSLAYAGIGNYIDFRQRRRHGFGQREAGALAFLPVKPGSGSA